jgi:hypothetical protein
MAEHGIELVIRWLLGLWATGLGLRFSQELLLADRVIILPKKYVVNIYLDFLPLAILGFIVAVLETKRIVQKIRHHEFLALPC